MALRVACWTACAFAQLLPDKPPEEFINTVYLKVVYYLIKHWNMRKWQYTALPIGILDNAL